MGLGCLHSGQHVAHERAQFFVADGDRARPGRHDSAAPSGHGQNPAAVLQIVKSHQSLLPGLLRSSQNRQSAARDQGVPVVAGGFARQNWTCVSRPGRYLFNQTSSPIPATQISIATASLKRMGPKVS